MSEENVELVRRLQFPETLELTTAFNDAEWIRAWRSSVAHLVEPEFETVLTPSFGAFAQPVLRGLDAVEAGWREWLGPWESFYVRPEEFIPVSGDRVLVLTENRCRSKTGGVEMRYKAGAIWTLRDRRVRRLELFVSRDPALEAAGLRE
jgi:ketosteroid isomerase-like protein